MSEQTVIEILEHINREVEHYRLLLTIVEKERDALLGKKHDLLMEIGEEKLSVAEQLVDMQKERRAMMSGLPGSPTKLSDLSSLLPVKVRDSFKTAVGQARQLAGRLSELSDLNKRYLEEALDTVEHLIAIFTGNAGGQAAYGKRGQAAMHARPPRLLAREV